MKFYKKKKESQWPYLAERESEDEVEAVEDEAAPEVAARLCRTAGTGLRLFLGAGTA